MIAHEGHERASGNPDDIFFRVSSCPSWMVIYFRTLNGSPATDAEERSSHNDPSS
jgi:hypothetical protein